MTVTYRSVNVLCALKLYDRKEEEDLSKRVGGPKKQKIDTLEVSVCSLSATPPVTPPATSTPVKEMPTDSLSDVITSSIAIPEYQCTPLPTTTAVPTSSETPMSIDTASSLFTQLLCTKLRPLDNLAHSLMKEEEEYQTCLTKKKKKKSQHVS